MITLVVFLLCNGIEYETREQKSIQLQVVNVCLQCDKTNGQPFYDLLLEYTTPLAVLSPHPYRKPSQHSDRARNPTICISRATRVEQKNSALDREITHGKELRHLDEFLGNQVTQLWVDFILADVVTLS